MAQRAALVCPTASVRTGSKQRIPRNLYPHELAPGLWRCGFNARSSYGAHSYFLRCAGGNLLVDSPRYLRRLKRFFAQAGGIGLVLLTHRDDVADAGAYAADFGARAWIHEDDADAAPWATDYLRGPDAQLLRDDVEAIPVPGHTRGSVVYRVAGRYLFTGDSLAWSFERNDLYAFREVCWFSWSQQANSLERLLAQPFEWVLAGHGGSEHRSAAEMRERLLGLVDRMRAEPQ